VAQDCLNLGQREGAAVGHPRCGRVPCSRSDRVQRPSCGHSLDVAGGLLKGTADCASCGDSDEPW
jgi:hypothetical protein